MLILKINYITNHFIWELYWYLAHPVDDCLTNSYLRKMLATEHLKYKINWWRKSTLQKTVKPSRQQRIVGKIRDLISKTYHLKLTKSFWNRQ